MSPNLAWLITAEVLWTWKVPKNEQLSSFFKPNNLLVVFFLNNQSTTKQSCQRVNKKRKIFSFLTCHHWRVPSSELICPLHQFCVCIVRLLLACIVVSCVFAWFWNFFAHLRESILQRPMILRQIFVVYQRTTHTAWRGRDAIGRRFLDPWRLKETYFQLGFISEKKFQLCFHQFFVSTSWKYDIHKMYWLF